VGGARPILWLSSKVRSWPILRLPVCPLPRPPRGSDRNPVPDCGPCTVKNDPKRSVAYPN
jgi:hypothetical protein